MLEIIKQPWHWSVAGLLIGLIVPTLLLVGNKSFGISSSLRHICAACIPAGLPFFQYNWKDEVWNLLFVLGIFLGGIVATQFLGSGEAIVLAEGTKNKLTVLGITDYSQSMPPQIFGMDNLLTARGFFFFVLGGFLVGFGTRYAGGCTSGHAIMGLSGLQWPSLVATCCFMAGGFVSANWLVPFLLKQF